MTFSLARTFRRPKSWLKGLFIVSSSLFLMSCGTESPSESNLNIYGGTRVKAGDWLQTVAIGSADKDKYVCTGTIVHPRLVITAAHCIKEGQKYGLYQGLGVEGSKPVQWSHTSIKVDRIWEKNRRDTAYIVTDKEMVIPKEHQIPILWKKAEVDEMLVAKGYAHIVGYGKYREKGTRKEGKGIKYEAESSLDKRQPVINDGHEVRIGTNEREVDSCNGDSGGPAFGKTKSGEWRVFGIVSRGPINCGIGGIWGLMHKSICEFKRSSGIDVDVGNYCTKEETYAQRKLNPDEAK